MKLNGPNGPGLQYVIKALPVASSSPGFADPMVSSAAFLASGALAAGDAPRFKLSVKNAGVAVPQAALVGQKLMIEVSALSAS